MVKRGRRTFGAKPEGKAKHKGGKGKAAKRKTGGKIKTKAKTANKNIRKKRQQQVSKTKASAPVDSPTLGNRETDEAAPASISDVTEVPPPIAEEEDEEKMQ